MSSETRAIDIKQAVVQINEFMDLLKGACGEALRRGIPPGIILIGIMEMLAATFKSNGHKLEELFEKLKISWENVGNHKLMVAMGKNDVPAG